MEWFPEPFDLLAFTHILSSWLRYRFGGVPVIFFRTPSAFGMDYFCSLKERWSKRGFVLFMRSMCFELDFIIARCVLS